MTLTSTTTKIQYNGDGSTVSFPITFIYWLNADIKVIHTDTSGTETTWVDGNQYTLTGGEGSTGALTVSISPTDYTPAIGETLTIKSNLPNTQTTTLPLGGALPSASIEERLDKNVRLLQQRSEELDRTPKLDESSLLSDITLPEPGAGKYIRWNLTGTDLEVDDGTINNSNFLQSGTGAVTRSVTSKIGEVLSVKDFGATGDGVTDDGAAIDNAITAAIAGGNSLYWPDGTYLTTASIASLHSVKHSGPGTIKRGSTTFTIEARDGDINSIYVSTTGTEDGITSSEPAALSSIPSLLKNYGPILYGSWRINFAAGTYSVGDLTLVDRIQSVERIRFIGPDVLGSPNVPTAIITQNSVSDVNGFEFIGAHVSVKDIKFTGYDDAASGSALLARETSDIFCDNVHTNVTSWVGINGQTNTRLRVQGGIIENSVHGIRAYAGTAFEVGDNSVAVSIKNCTNSGVKVQNASTGTVVASTIDNCGTGIMIHNNSRARVSTNTIKNNAVGVGVSTGSTWVRDTDNTWTTNTIDFAMESSCTELNQGVGTISEGVYSDSTQFSHTGDTNLTESHNLFNIPADYFIDTRQRLYCRAWGTASGAGGTKTVGLRFGASQLSSLAVASGTVDWEYELIVIPTGASGQKYFGKVRVGSTTTDATGTRTVAMTGSQDVKFWVQLANSGDTVIVEHVEVSLGG